MASPSVLQYPFINSLYYSESFCSTLNPLQEWLNFGMIGESAVITPSYTVQEATVGAKNRYLDSVVVTRIPLVTGNISLAVGGETSLIFSGANSATTTNSAAATVTVLNGTTTITGVAAGTTTVTILDINSDKIATFTVTVA